MACFPLQWLGKMGNFVALSPTSLCEVMIMEASAYPPERVRTVSRADRAVRPRSCPSVRGAVIALVALTGWLSAGVAQSASYPANYQFIEVPAPLSGVNPTYPLQDPPVALPAIGASEFDERFGTVKTRVTQTNSYNGRHEYSRFDPFNSDQSMILLVMESGDWSVYRTQSMPYNTPANLVRTFSLEEPRWDRSVSTLMWGLDEFSIVTLDVVSGNRTVIKDFSADPVLGPIIGGNPVFRITTQAEGEASSDGRYWALMLQGNEQADYNPLFLFCWDRSLDQIVGTYALPANERSIDWIGMSARGDYVVIGADEVNTGGIVGLTMATRTFDRFHRLGFSTAHSDVGVDSLGQDVIVMQNISDQVDLIPIDWSTSPILDSSQSYTGTNIVPLIRLYYDDASPDGFHGGIHVSCNYPGWAVVSTYTEPGVAEQNWLDRCNVLVRLDRASPQVYYLAKVHNTTQAYWEETQASITNDGRKVVWTSNWGQNVGLEQVFLMELEMPPAWDGMQSRSFLWQLYR